MYGAAFGFEKQVFWVAVVLILRFGVFDRLTCKVVFEFHSHHRQTIDKQCYVY